MPTRELRRTRTSFPILQHKYTSSEFSASLRISEDALYSPAGLGETYTRVHHTHLQTSSRDSSLEMDQLLSYQPVWTDHWDILDTEENQDTQDIRCCSILILETLIFTDSSSHIWSSSKIQSDLGLLEQKINLISWRRCSLQTALHISIVDEHDDLDKGDAALHRQLSTYLLEKQLRYLWERRC